jgi:60 kDa SS-A/Ro ribonucleoprotein
MANQALFGTQASRERKLPKTTVRNAAGGKAYSRSDEAALAQFAATGMFNNTFYVKAEKQLEEAIALAMRVPVDFLAKVAVYSRRHAYLKDMPALLVAVLATRDSKLFKQVFPLVIDNGRMLRNFVQVMRSGVVGRRSLGSAPKKAVQRWFTQSTDDYIFKASVGNSPSIVDVIKMVHPSPETKSRDALYAYLLDKKYDKRSLPKLVKSFEKFKKGSQGERKLPAVPFQMLDSAGLSTEEWKQVARDGRWMFTRMNLRTFARHGVLKDKAMVKLIADRLGSKELAQKARQYPYQVLTAWKMVEHDDNIPATIKRALHDAVDHTCGNIPEFNGRTAVLVDISGSMTQPMNGAGYMARGQTGQVTCMEVAGLFAAAIARKNPDAVVYQFHTQARRVHFNAMDSVFTNMKKIVDGRMGGTSISAGLLALMRDFKAGDLPDNVIIISDNESWADAYGHGYSYGGTAHGATATQHAFSDYKAKNRKARLILMDLTPSSDTQVKDNADILNVGGFSDAVFDTVAGFIESRGTQDFWAQKIRDEISIG